MPKYIKSYSSYTKRDPHMVQANGAIFEEDFVTFRDNVLIEDTNINLTESNFAYTITASNNDKKKYSISSWLTPPVSDTVFNDEFWRLEDTLTDDDKVNTALSGGTLSQTIILNPDMSDLRNLSYFGSITELINASINDIISTFPASIYVSNTQSTFTQFQYVVLNPFSINLINKTIDLSPTIDDMFNNYSNYQIVRSSDESWNYCSGSTTYEDIILNEDLKENIVSFSQTFETICNTNVLSNVVFTGESGSTITLNYSYQLDGYNNKTTTLKEITAVVAYFDTSSFTGLHIRPNDTYINNFFNNLSDFESYLLNRYSLPKYSSYFNIPQESEDGVEYVRLDFTWPTLDGWNLDIESTAYLNFIQSISQAATTIDNYDSDNLYRMLTHDSIKNLDYTEKVISNSDGEADYVEGYNKIEKVIRIYGRNLDEIKKYIDNISFVNNITYDNIENLPNILFKDYLKYSGIETSSIIYSGNYKDGSYNLYKTNSLFSGYSKRYNPYDVEIEFYRRLIINLPYVLRTKGTKRSIEMIMNLFGVPRSLYDIKQYIYLADSSISTDDVASIVSLNQTLSYTLSGTEYIPEILSYENENSTAYVNEDDLHDLCIERDNDGTGVPAFKGNTSNLYYQQGGGWYRETLGYLNEVDAVSDLYSLKISTLYACIIYYVNDIDTNLFLGNYFILQDINNYNNSAGWYNVSESELNGVQITYTDIEGNNETFVVNINALLNIKDINTGNNPHTGYGRYDRGLDYIWHFGKTDDYNSPSSASLFKYTIDNTPLCVKNNGWEQYTNLFNYGFSLKRYVDTKRAWYVNTSGGTNVLMIDPTYNINSKTILYSSGNTIVNYLNCNQSSLTDNNFNTRKVDNFTVNNYKLLVNTKNIDIILTEENDDFKEEFYDIILPYIEQVIPSTSILNILLTYNSEWIGDFDYFYCSGLNDGYKYAKILKKVSLTDNTIDLDINGNDVTVSGLRQAILTDSLYPENPNEYLYIVVGTFDHSQYSGLTEEFNPDDCPMTGSITIDSGVTFLYNIDSGDSKYVSMTSTNNWMLYNSPALVNIVPSSGDSTITQILCNRLGWGNDSIVLKNTRTHEKATCIVQAIYLEAFYNNAILNNLSFINTGGNYTFNVVVKGGSIEDYNITYSGASNFTYVENNINSITITASTNNQTNIVNGIITLTHKSNSLVYKNIYLYQAAAVIDYENQWSSYVCEEINSNTEVYNYNFNWQNYICTKELAEVTTYEYNWENYICSKYQVTQNNISWSLDVENAGYIDITSDYPVASNLTIVISVAYTNPHGGVIHGSTTLQLLQGQTTTSVDWGANIQSVTITSITPSFDNQYNYVINN